MYKADNLEYVGETAGNTKMHLHGINKQFERKSVCKKLVYCKWVKGRKLATEYQPTWNAPNVIKGQISIFDLLI